MPSRHAANRWVHTAKRWLDRLFVGMLLAGVLVAGVGVIGFAAGISGTLPAVALCGGVAMAVAVVVVRFRVTT